MTFNGGRNDRITPLVTISTGVYEYLNRLCNRFQNKRICKSHERVVRNLMNFNGVKQSKSKTDRLRFFFRTIGAFPTSVAVSPEIDGSPTRSSDTEEMAGFSFRTLHSICRDVPEYEKKTRGRCTGFFVRKHLLSAAVYTRAFNSSLGDIELFKRFYIFYTGIIRYL